MPTDLSWFTYLDRELCSNSYPDPVCRDNYTLRHYYPPLLYNLYSDPGEIYNLNVSDYSEVMGQIYKVCYEAYTILCV